MMNRMLARHRVYFVAAGLTLMVSPVRAQGPALAIAAQARRAASKTAESGLPAAQPKSSLTISKPQGSQPELFLNNGQPGDGSTEPTASGSLPLDGKATAQEPLVPASTATDRPRPTPSNVRPRTSKQVPRAAEPTKPLRETRPPFPRLEPTIEPPDAQAAPVPMAVNAAPELDPLRDKIRQTLAWYSQRRLNTRDHNCWEVMHSIVAYGVDCELSQGTPKGKPVNAIGWLCYGGSCQGISLLHVEGGRVAARKGPKVQGHQGQFLAILAQSYLQRDYPLRVGGKSFTLEDLIQSEMRGCETGTELTFKLISLAHYLDTDTEWKNFKGETWSIPRLIAEEIKAPINGAACGGTHRLMGISYAYHLREERGEPVDGEYLRARTYIEDYQRYTFRLQNPDGSFSTDWFKGRGAQNDIDRRIKTTGHILEWMAYSVPAATLTDPRLVKAVQYLTDVLAKNTDHTWEIGPLGHALHALAIYDRRQFQPFDQEVPVAVGFAEKVGRRKE